MPCSVNTLQLAIMLSRYSKRSDSACAHYALDLSRIAKSLHRYAENQCNREVTKRESNRAHRLLMQAQEILKTELEIAGATVSSNNDPRGFGLYLHMPGKEHNTWGGAEHGFGVE